MKFLADMGISPKTVDFLRDLGHDALHLHDRGLDRLPDPAVLGEALDEQRVLLTHDLDFGELMAASGDNLPSVVIFRLRNMQPRHVNHYLHGIIAHHQGELEQGAIISVTEGQIRMRLLPLSGDA